MYLPLLPWQWSFYISFPFFSMESWIWEEAHFPPSILPPSSSNLHPGQLSWLEPGVAFKGSLYSCKPPSFGSFESFKTRFYIVCRAYDVIRT